MSGPSTGALATLLASHPEECAAVVAVLCAHGDTLPRPLWAEIRDTLVRFGLTTIPRLEEIEDIVNACIECGIVCSWRDGFTVEGADRYAIARMGAAAWLAARVAP